MAYGVSNGQMTDDVAVAWPQRFCEAVRSAILATTWLLVSPNLGYSSVRPTIREYKVQLLSISIVALSDCQVPKQLGLPVAYTWFTYHERRANYLSLNWTARLSGTLVLTEDEMQQLLSVFPLYLVSTPDYSKSPVPLQQATLPARMRTLSPSGHIFCSTSMPSWLCCDRLYRRVVFQNRLRLSV